MTDGRMKGYLDQQVPYTSAQVGLQGGTMFVTSHPTVPFLLFVWCPNKVTYC